MAFAICLQPCHALEYPLLDDANTQVFILRDPHVDIALRIAALERAKTIDMISYVQGTDQYVGLPLLQAFRRAAERGVAARYLFSKVGELAADRKGLVRSMITDASLRRPGELIIFGGLRALLTHFHLFDMPHQKIVILDRGTPQEIIFFGGRNNWRNTLTDLDLAFVMRRLDASKPYVGDQLQHAFDAAWSLASGAFKPYPPQKITPGLLPLRNEHSDVPLREAEQQAQFELINGLLQKPVDQAAPPLEFEVRPRQMGAVSNDLLSRVASGTYGSGVFKRRRDLPSDTIANAARFIAKARRIDICAMSVFMPRPLKEAVIAALKAGAEVNVFMNGRKSHSTMMMWGVAFDYSLPDLSDLIRAGGRLNIYALSPSLIAKAGGRYALIKYMHRKLVVADDYVSAGSENFNDSSREYNEELNFFAEDAEFAKKLRSLLDDDMKVFKRLDCERLLSESGLYGRSLVKRVLNWFFSPLY